MNQKGFAPLVFIIIGVIVIASAVFGVVKLFKYRSAMLIYNIDTSSSDASWPAPPEGHELAEDIGASPSACEICGKDEDSGQEVIYKEIIKEIIKEVPVIVPGSCPDLPAKSVGTKTIFFNIPVFNGSVPESTPGLDSDLVIKVLNFYPPEPIEGDMMTFWAIIKNQGQGNAVNSSTVRLNIDGNFWDEATIMGLASNKAGNVVWDKEWRAISGRHAFEVCIEENNCTKIEPIIPKTLTLPDYVIESNSIIPNNPSSGNILSFSVIVKNQGRISGIGSSWVSFYLDINNDGKWDITTKDAFVDTLVPKGKERELFKFVWAATKGTHRYEICADSGLNIKESNEANNCVSKIFRID